MTCSVPVPFHFEALNIKLEDENQDGEMSKSVSSLTVKVPNGLYKTILRLSNSEDPEGLRFDWLADVTSRLNEDTFK